jgi:hypothetical protein
VRKIVLSLLLAAALLVPASAQHNTRLGTSLFWAIEGLRSHQSQLDANLQWVRSTLGADYVRSFVYLGGDQFLAPDGSYRDPWEGAATPPANVLFERWVATTTDYVFDHYGLKVHWVLTGSRFPIQSAEARESLVRNVADQLRGREHKVELIEIWNEYTVNGGTADEVCAMSRQLRSLMSPGFPIALSSPTSTHSDNSSTGAVQAEIARMYQGADYCGANVFTYHASRPANVWGPDRILRLLGAGVSRRNSEPRGPGASAGGDVTNPQVLADDYRASIAAGEAGYVFHSLGGIWGGRANGWPAENRWANIYDAPNAAAIAGRLRALRGAGAGIQPNQPDPTTPVVPGQPTQPVGPGGGGTTQPPPAVPPGNNPAGDAKAYARQLIAEIERLLAELRKLAQ